MRIMILLCSFVIELIMARSAKAADDAVQAPLLRSAARPLFALPNDGQIFRVTYVDSSMPRPVAAWAAGPLEARVAFDRPIDASALAGLVGRSIPFGENVRAAERLELQRPKNKDVQAKPAAPRGTLRIAAARLDDGGRTLVLTTDPHPSPLTYALTLPAIKAAGKAGPGATVDLAYDLSGVEASWKRDPGDAVPAWTHWWPHIDPDVARLRTLGSAEHDRAFAQLRQPGQLTLHTLVELPAGQVTVQLQATGPFEAALGGEPVKAAVVPGGMYQLALATESTGDAIPLDVTAATGHAGKALVLHVSHHTAQDQTKRLLAGDRQFVPWAPPRPPKPAAGEAPPDLAGGDRTRGEAVFFSQEARCSACHTVRGQGGTIGPDLSNLGPRDPVSVYRDIREPSAAVNLDYVSYVVSTRGGQVVTGIVRAEGADAIRVLDTDAKQTIIPRSEIEELRPTSSSIMPEGLAGALGEAKVRDLLAFLRNPPEPAKNQAKPNVTKGLSRP